MLGAAGFVGTNLIRALRSAGHVTVGVDSLDPRIGSTTEGLPPRDESFVFIQDDASRSTLLEELLRGADVVFNCAAQTSHVKSLAQPEHDLDVNCRIALRVLEAARRVQPRAVHVYPSTSTVLGRVAGIGTEESLPRPRDFYSAHKALVEHYHRIYAAVYDLPVVVLRLPNMFGPFGKEAPEYGVVNHFIARARAGSDVPVFDEGSQTRNVLFIEDAVEAMIQSATNERLRGEPLFVLGDQELTVREVAEFVVAAFGGRVAQARFPEERRRIDSGPVHLSDARFRGLTGWRPQHDLKSGLARTRTALT